MTPRYYYSQHGEDKLLYEVFKGVENGRYVDIGAYEPEFNSVTKIFYDEGWRGTNVEPNPRAFQMLENQRPEDINIKAAVTYKEEVQPFYLVDRKGWSSLDAGVAKLANQNGMETTLIEVETITLAEVMEGPQVHFLKIDVEGAEEEVIASGDWKNHRPWLVMAEAYMPNTRKMVRNLAWEPFLISRGYVFKLDDGLNRYYIEKDNKDIAF